jgi:hypothetical protein
VILTILIASYASNKIHRLDNIQKAFVTVSFVLILSYVSDTIVSYLSLRCMKAPTYNEVNNIFINNESHRIVYNNHKCEVFKYKCSVQSFNDHVVVLDSIYSVVRISRFS